MSNADIIKSLVRMKMQIVNNLISLLPQDMKEHAVNLEQNLLEAIGEAARKGIQEGIKDGKAENKIKALKKVPVE